MSVQFLLNGAPVSVENADHHVSLLQWLRNTGFTGAKEGCAEGECGACAVVQVRPNSEGGCRLEPLNSCLLSLADAHGRDIVTVEGVASSAIPNGSSAHMGTPHAIAAGKSLPLHPVQEAMVRFGGSQCGYCTPGFVVSLYCEYYRAGRTTPDPEAISGNLCRCTGYRPILEALNSLPPATADRVSARLSEPSPPLPALSHAHAGRKFLRPVSLEGALDALAERPGALALAGGTDVMVAVNQRHQRFDTLVALDAVPELRRIERTPNAWVIGAGATLSEVERALHDADAPQAFAQLLPLFSSRLIRNRATLGGNLATASPIGDSAPVLLALDAGLKLVSRAGERLVPLHEFFLGYRKTALQPGELIVEVHIPQPFPALQRFYKVSKRPLDDISTVSGAFALNLDHMGRVHTLRLAYGGVAGTPLRAREAEALAIGQLWSRQTQRAVRDKLTQLGTPMSDHRGSADYRRAMMGSLFERFCVETSAAESSTTGASVRERSTP